MLTKKTFKPALEMRNKPPSQLPMLEHLAERMGEFWGAGRPSDCALAPGLVYESGFMRVKQPSRLLSEKLNGKRLIDLGAGNIESLTAMAHLAAVLGVSEYIAVEKYIDYGRAEGLIEAFMGDSYPQIVFRAFNDDMLLFLTKMKDGSANIVMNSVDRSILVPPNHLIGEMYGLELASEIARVVPAGGIAFGVNSPTLERLAQFGFKGVYENPGLICIKGEK
jgi:hypothetical protein